VKQVKVAGLVPFLEDEVPDAKMLEDSRLRQ
jgi:hypothetical protein